MATRLRFTAAQAVNVALSQVGLTEHPAGSNRQPYSLAFDVRAAAWCAYFLGWVYKRLGFDVTTVAPHFAWTPSFAVELRAAGWDPVALSAARAGDIVFLNVDNDAAIDHVGMVRGRYVSGVLPTVEGNTTFGPSNREANGGAVAKRERRGSQVVAIIRPPYAVPTAPLVIKRTLRLSEPQQHGADVKAVQRLVGVEPDGYFGPHTRAAVKTWQRRHGLVPDGRFGPASTRRAGWRWSA
jgi:peptidoglycan hydrolase-like protein with peptidoglycan-binding domain